MVLLAIMVLANVYVAAVAIAPAAAGELDDGGGHGVIEDHRRRHIAVLHGHTLNSDVDVRRGGGGDLDMKYSVFLRTRRPADDRLTGPGADYRHALGDVKVTLRGIRRVIDREGPVRMAWCLIGTGYGEGVGARGDIDGAGGGGRVGSLDRRAQRATALPVVAYPLAEGGCRGRRVLSAVDIERRRMDRPCRDSQQ